MAPYSLHLRNIPARAHRRCAVCTTWGSAVVFTQLLAGGERNEKAISWAAQGRVAGALRSLLLPGLLAWSGERRGEAAPGPRGQGGFEGAAAAPAPSPQPQFPSPPPPQSRSRRRRRCGKSQTLLAAGSGEEISFLPALASLS